MRLMPNGNLRQANLRKLFEKAKDYEKISFKGLFNFITFIEKVGEKASGGREAKMLSENDDVVRIMTIHKSKGLEFPIVFLCGTHGKFNVRDTSQKIVYDQTLGIGMDFVQKGIKYPTIVKKVINEKLRKESISEEMRILYVALTRAKEKIIITGCEKDAESKLENKRKLIEKYYGSSIKTDKIKPDVFETSIRYLDWFEILYTYMSEDNKVMELNIINKNDLKVSQAKEEEKIKIAQGEIDEEKYKTISNMLNWKYKFEKSIDAISKTSVTAIKKEKIEFSENKIPVIESIGNDTTNNSKQVLDKIVKRD